MRCLNKLKFWEAFYAASFGSKLLVGEVVWKHHTTFTPQSK